MQLSNPWISSLYTSLTNEPVGDVSAGDGEPATNRSRPSATRPPREYVSPGYLRRRVKAATNKPSKYQVPMAPPPPPDEGGTAPPEEELLEDEELDELELELDDELELLLEELEDEELEEDELLEDAPALLRTTTVAE